MEGSPPFGDVSPLAPPPRSGEGEQAGPNHRPVGLVVNRRRALRLQSVQTIWVTGPRWPGTYIWYSTPSSKAPHAAHLVAQK